MRVEKRMPAADSAPDFRPLYAQVRELMVQRLISGAWKPGSILPSETELANQFRVSQGTVRKALDELADQNIVVRKQGRGTFIAEHSRSRSLFHFFHIVDRDGRKELPASRLIEIHAEPCDAEQAERLHLSRRARVYRMLRLRALEGRPVILERLTVPAELFPNLDRRLPLDQDMVDELYVLYQKSYGVTIVRAHEMLSAVAVDALDRRYLSLAADEPVLQIDRVAHDLEGRPVEWRVSHCDTCRHAYRSDID